MISDIDLSFAFDVVMNSANAVEYLTILSFFIVVLWGTYGTNGNQVSMGYALAGNIFQTTVVVGRKCYQISFFF